jgi:transcriptional regulator with XRE-family HTH domain
MIDVAEQPNRLRQLREEAGLTRRDLAVAIDRTEETIRRFEENRGGPIPSEHIPTLSDLLSRELNRAVTGDHLMGWDRIPAGTGEVA